MVWVDPKEFCIGAEAIPWPTVFYQIDQIAMDLFDLFIYFWTRTVFKLCYVNRMSIDDVYFELYFLRPKGYWKLFLAIKIQRNNASIKHVLCFVRSCFPTFSIFLEMVKFGKYTHAPQKNGYTTPVWQTGDTVSSKGASPKVQESTTNTQESFLGGRGITEKNGGIWSCKSHVIYGPISRSWRAYSPEN